MLKNSFCSSPWFHLRLTYNGDYVQCRWATQTVPAYNIKTTSLTEYYNSDEMNSLRLELLKGSRPDLCKSCHYQEDYGKLNGRPKQLIKSGITVKDFELTTRSSPHYPHFLYSNENGGRSDYFPVDLQIDLGNVCNSACIMCSPVASSKLHSEYIKLHKINPVQFKNPEPYKSWTQDPVLLDKLVNDIGQIPNLKYIHFLGGETLYDPAFYNICERLIDAGISKNIIIGTTTNGTLYDSRIEKIIEQFKEFHLGISIETVDKLNDYIRYPGNINVIKSNIKKFLDLRDRTQLNVSLRITPNIFTMYAIDELTEFMIENRVIAESCNILYKPDVLKVELLPDDIRQEIIVKLKRIIEKYNFTNRNTLNARRQDLVSDVIGDTVMQYLTFMENYTVPENAEELRHQLITFLKSFESVHNNSILDYAPRYKEFLRSYGY